MKNTQDICETAGCTKVAQVGYLGAPLCMTCKNQIQDHKFENGGLTMAVAGFKSNHPVAFATGRIQDNH